MESEEDALFLIVTTRELGRWDDMFSLMMDYIKRVGKLNAEEKGLLSISLKNVFFGAREAIREISEESGEIAKFKTKIETEVKLKSSQVIQIVSNVLLKNSDSEESNVLYYKILGDMYRYQNENQLAFDSYTRATDIAERFLIPTHPLRLGVAYHFALYWRAVNSPESAIKVIKNAFDLAISEIDDVPDEFYKETSLVLQFLREALAK